MKDIVIVGSGISALILYFFLKKFDKPVISSSNLINNLDNLTNSMKYKNYQN